jgi:hypothetical protein
MGRRTRAATAPRGCTRSSPPGPPSWPQRVAPPDALGRHKGPDDEALEEKTTIADPAAAARTDRICRDFTGDASKLNSRDVPGREGEGLAGQR